MSQTPPDRMSPTEIVAEIGELQKELSGKFLRIQLLSKGLYGRVRRATPDDNTAIYLRYANTWMQFSGVANQGLKRSANVSRILRSLEPDAPQIAPKIQPKPQPKEASLSPMEQLLRSYSEEPEDKKPYRSLSNRQPVRTQQERFASQEIEDGDDGEDLSAFDEDLDGN